MTITQYLRPTPRHHPVERWVKPEEFVELREEAEEIGFAGVMSGPLVRSSYRAGRLYRQALDSRGAEPVPPALSRSMRLTRLGTHGQGAGAGEGRSFFGSAQADRHGVLLHREAGQAVRPAGRRGGARSRSSLTVRRGRRSASAWVWIADRRHGRAARHA